MVEFMEKVSSLNDSEELNVEERNLSLSPTRMSSAPPGASSIHLLHQAGGGVPWPPQAHPVRHFRHVVVLPQGCFNSNCGGCYMAAVEDSHCLTR
ncbi:hypothetical protein RHGRI_034213 [Rhododendron griersonianum]|uniref:Uncharacterized protein n=1 Tax=Rhododendron griersonianum TaxID=479676 RepID=A0AAV6I040_9ERIC|nr:hypothetical protein RHGRI_034213 [Rhododendron griersonianum]